MSGVKTEVDGRVADERVELTRAGLVLMEVRASCAFVVVAAVADKRVELTRAGLVSMEVRASCAFVVVVAAVAGVEATAAGRLAVTNGSKTSSSSQKLRSSGHKKSLRERSIVAFASNVQLLCYK